MADIRTERFMARRQLIADYVAERDGVKMCELIKLIGLSRTQVADIVNRTEKLGDIWRSKGLRYFRDEAHFLAVGVEDQNRRTAHIEQVVRSRGNEGERHYGLKFLSRKRPDSINTIFDECRQNSTILPVLKVMARRFYG
ncbi:hypothetical protein M2403_002023 [Rahnella sp. BIGb0603]|uniref:hypothetical protein n=1 Tax=Rahnella sp. BIGb0603 TaxID=2940612 RepID=UPI0021692631|nr:hypothetical protein [Rahnella sp. BIGb0603]MCS3423422.1 hypothetical protein [Rahnella sp. BIGb0603]